MADIFRLDDSTLYLCDGCLRDLGPVPGKWMETPLETCSVCGEIDLQSQEEMYEYHNHMDNLQWEDEQQEPDYDPQEMK